MCIDAVGSAFNEKIDLLMISLPKSCLQILCPQMPSDDADNVPSEDAPSNSSPSEIEIRLNVHVAMS